MTCVRLTLGTICTLLAFAHSVYAGESAEPLHGTRIVDFALPDPASLALVRLLVAADAPLDVVTVNNVRMDEDLARAQCQVHVRRPSAGEKGQDADENAINCEVTQIESQSHAVLSGVVSLSLKGVEITAMDRFGPQKSFIMRGDLTKTLLEAMQAYHVANPTDPMLRDDSINFESPDRLIGFSIPVTAKPHEQSSVECSEFWNSVHGPWELTMRFCTVNFVE